MAQRSRRMSPSIVSSSGLGNGRRKQESVEAAGRDSEGDVGYHFWGFFAVYRTLVPRNFHSPNEQSFVAASRAGLAGPFWQLKDISYRNWV